MEEESRNPRRFTAVGCLVVGVVGVLVVAALIPPIRVARQAVQRASCIMVQKCVGLAAHNYGTVFERLPAAYCPDQFLETHYSWRIALLPYMEENEIYNSYKRQEPWDSPNNIKVAGPTPHMKGYWAYHCPGDGNRQPRETDFLMPVGPGAISEGTKGRRFKEVTDGLSHTIFSGESCSSGIIWTEPRDLDIEQMSFQINDNSRPSIRSVHPGLANVLLADGSVKTLSEKIDPAVVRAMITVADGEDVSSALR